MPNNISRKLKIAEGDTLRTINAPPRFAETLSPLPGSVTISDSARNCEQVHWFVQNRSQLEKGLSRVLGLLKPGVIAWIYYPKGSSGLQTDLTRDKGWDCLAKEEKRLTWISLISFDDTWSVFGIRPRTDADTKKKEKSPAREIFNWVDPIKKTVRLPEDLAGLLRKNKTRETFFHSLSFTNKKEYIEWIITAKKEETRKQRLKDTMERLGKRCKNPRNL